MHESDLRAKINRQVLILGALAGINIFLFMGFAKLVFDNSQDMIQFIFTGLTILAVGNFLINRSKLSKSKQPSEEENLARLERTYRQLTRIKWILIGLIPFFLFAGPFLKK